jgi:hypothetical protein
MKKTFPLLFPAFLSFLALLFTSCGSSPASVIEDLIEETNEITDILNGIESKEDYEDAKEDLKGRGDKCEELSDEMKKMKDELSQEEKDELEEEYKDKLNDSFGNMMKASMKAAQHGFKMSDIR